MGFQIRGLFGSPHSLLIQRIAQKPKEALDLQCVYIYTYDHICTYIYIDITIYIYI